MKKLKLYKFLLAAFALVIAGVIYTYTFADDKAEVSEVMSSETEALETAEGAEVSVDDDFADIDSEPEYLCVHVCGCVVSPGVYYLEHGARVYDAVQAAGGFDSSAAESYLNLAAFVEDGMQVYVPDEGEEVAAYVGVIPSSDVSGTSDDGLVNINTASAEELTALPGIGEVKAAAIVSYRENVGSFASTEDIMNVSGIGESSYERIKDLIKV